MHQPASIEILADCPLCRLATLTTRTGDRFKISCAHCGEFTLTDTARILVESLPNQFHVALTRALDHASKQNRPITITLQNLASLISPFL